MSDEQVLQLPDAPPVHDGPLQLVAPRTGACEHHQTEVDPERRVLACANPACGAVLDPFDLLVRLAREDRRWRQSYERLQELREEMIVHAPGAGRHTLCGSDSDLKEYRVTVTNLLRDVACLRCRATLTRQGKASPFWDARITAGGQVRRGRDLRRDHPAAWPLHHECGDYHRPGECPRAQACMGVVAEEGAGKT